MNTPYGIFEYKIDTFSSYIAYQTNTDFAFIKQKPQIYYLNNYISNFIDDENNIVFLYENNYTDKHYIEDYTTYYARCFHDYKKTTSRIHFFKISKTITDYKKIVKEAFYGNKDILNNDNYLGFIVIRPIPKTFLAKVCLKPYYLNNHSRLEKYSITTKYDVSLFGISLNIETIAFQEQDRILSACATTALWSFFHAHDKISHISLPSSSAITKNAYPEQNGYSREFPNVGLSTEMICRGLRSCNLIPEYFEFSNKSVSNRMELLKELIFAYCSSGFPLILGIDVSGDVENKGLHAVTILGYSITKQKNTKLYAHDMDKLYVHDDRYGPFLRIEFEKDSFNVSLDENNGVTSEQIFPKETYNADTLIIGLYHKIRISYISIKTTCLMLNKNMIEFFSSVVDESFEDEIKILESIKWDISIVTNSDLKKKIINNNDIYAKEVYLVQPLPKYIWSARVMIEDSCEFELLFDATDIEQSNVFLGFIIFNEDLSLDIYEMVSSYCLSTTSYQIKDEKFDYFNTAQDNFLSGIKKYFKQQQSYKDNLTDLYGYLKIPEYIKTEEIEEDIIINRIEARLNSEVDPEEFTLDKDLDSKMQYIWLIDKDGFLCIGTEKIGSNQGHPTLTNGNPARIGGELMYNHKKEIWEVNSSSGRYSRDYDEDKQLIYLNNARKYKFEVFFPHSKFD